MGIVVSVRIPDEIATMLDKVMKFSKKNRSEILVEAIALGLAEMLRMLEKALTLSRIVDDILKKNVRVVIKGSESIVDIVKRERE